MDIKKFITQHKKILIYITIALIVITIIIILLISTTKKCSVDCDKCTDGKCTKCKNSHYSIESNCTTCTSNFTLKSKCTDCANPKFKGPDCTTCADSKFKGPECTTCLNPKFTGSNCTTCADSKFTGSNCTTCADSKFTGSNCTTCVDAKFKGPECTTCADAKFKGPECTTCLNPKFKGPECTTCVNPNTCEVFIVSNNKYKRSSIDDIGRLTKKYDATFATLGQLNDVKTKGAQWCVPGMSADTDLSYSYWPMNDPVKDALHSSCGTNKTLNVIKQNDKYYVHLYGVKPSQTDTPDTDGDLVLPFYSPYPSDRISSKTTSQWSIYSP